MFLWAKFLSSSLITKVLIGLGLSLAIGYGSAYLIRGYKEIKQNLYRSKTIKENKKHVKEECAYGFTDNC